jgi:hypothetical protein
MLLLQWIFTWVKTSLATPRRTNDDDVALVQLAIFKLWTNVVVQSWDGPGVMIAMVPTANLVRYTGSFTEGHKRGG